MQKLFLYFNKPWLLYTVFGIALFLTVLPIAIRFAGQYALTHFGAQKAQIENVDLNLFTGYAAIEGVQVEYQNKPTLSLKSVAVNIGLLSLFKQRILVEELAVNGLALDIYSYKGQWVIGIPLPKSDEQAKPTPEPENNQPSAWQFGVNQLALNDINIKADYQNQTHDLSINQLAIEAVKMWQINQQSDLQLDAKVNGAQLLIDSHFKPFVDAPTLSANLQLKAFDLSVLKPFLPKDIQALAAKLSIDSQLDLTLSKQQDLSLHQNGRVALTLEQLAVTDLQAQFHNLSWQGKTDIQIKAKQQPVIHASGTVQLDALTADYQPLLLQTTLEQLQLPIKAQVDLQDAENSLTLSADLTLKQWHLLDQQENADLANFDTLALDAIALSGIKQIKLDRLSLKQLQALENKDKSLAALGDIEVQSIQLNNLNHLAINRITLADLLVNLKLNKNGQIDGLTPWIASLQKRLNDSKPASNKTSTPPVAAETENKNKEKAFSYQINSLEFNKDNRIYFTDASLTPAIVHPMQIKTLTLGAIDSQKTQQRMPLDIQLKLYKHAVFNVKGDITPLADIKQMNGNIKANIAGIELPLLSPYIVKAIGYTARSGQFNSDSDFAINKGQLKSETKIKIQRIKFEPADQAIIDKVGKNLSMPVSTALKIITDSKDNLKLTIPVTGNLTDPNIKVSRIMAGAINQALQNAAITYFKYAMQPFGAIFLVSEAISNAHLQARFEDVLFEPGTAEIIPKQKEYLAKVANMIKEKKDFSIIACVQVTEQDFATRKNPPEKVDGKYQWDEQSKQLAQQRLQLIRGQLIDTYGLSVSQVQSCEPSLGKGKPRAVMGI